MDNWIILDFSAVMNHCLNAGEGAEFEYDTISGRKVNTAEHGFANFLDFYINPILEIARPDQILVAHDSGCEYREFIFPEYKKKRKERKEEESDGESARQLERLKFLSKSFMASLGIAQAQVKGVEADDLINYFTDGLIGNCRVYTSDVDILQLASDNVQVFIKGIWVNPNEITEDCPKMAVFLHDLIGVTFPKYISLYKSLVGDASDEYQGIKGFGDSKFAQMVEDIGVDGLDEVIECLQKKNYKALEDCASTYTKPPKWLDLMLGDTQNWHMCWRLANLKPSLCEAPWRNKITKIKWFKRVPNKVRAMDILADARCSELIDDYENYFPETWLIDSTNFEENDLKEFTELCKKSPCIAFDYETFDDQYEQFQKASNGRGHVDVSRSQITGISFCLGANLEAAFYITVDHKDSHNLDKSVVAKFFDAIPKECIVVAHNSSFELSVTQKQLDKVLEDVHDTMIMSNYVDEDELSGLKFLSKSWLNYNQATFDETIKKSGVPNGTMRDLTAAQVLSYGIDDSIVTAHLWTLFRVIMMLEKTWEFYSQYEPCTTNVISHAYCSGTVMDWDKQAEVHAQDLKVSQESEQALREILSKHCGKPNPEFMANFFKVEERSWRAIARDKYKDLPNERFKELGGTREEVLPNLVNEFVESQKQSFLKLAEYEPYHETLVYPEVKPTVKTINKVAVKLGLNEIASLSMKAIKEYCLQHNPFSFDGEAENNLTPEQKQFVELISKASNQIKDRSGKSYDEFMDFCKKHLDLKPKVVKSGTELNMASPKQVQALLYIILGLPVRLFSKPQQGSVRQRLKLKGSPATDAIAIDTALAEDCSDSDWRTEALHHVKKIKDAETRISLYHVPYPLWRHPDDDLIYPSIRNFNTVTGRPTGSNPNLLQVSKHQQDGVMRSLYLPRKRDHIIVAIDFNGQELRILASVSRDENLLSAYLGSENAKKVTTKTFPVTVSHSFTTEEVIFRDDLSDIHSMTASGMTKVFGLPKMDYSTYVSIYNDENNPDHKTAQAIRKRPAKQTNFLLAYGGTAPTLSVRLIIPEKQAQMMMDSTHATYPNIKLWQNASADFARKHGYTLTAYGKRRHANNDLFSKEGGKRNRIERQLNNAEIQGTAADILKIVLSESWKTKLWQETGAYMIAPVYDEVVASVPIDNAIPYIRRMCAIMNITPKGQPVPMAADVSIGHNWQAQIELGMSPSDEEILQTVEKIRPLVEAKWDSIEGKFKNDIA